MHGLTSEVLPDGQTEITETTDRSNYDMSINRVDGTVPDTPSMDAVAKLFKPRFVLNVTADDGTVIPFVYKRLDPGTMMITHGNPIAISGEQVKQVLPTYERVQELRDKGIAAGGDLPAEDIAEMRELLADPTMREITKIGVDMRKNTVQSGVIDPVITDEVYEQLDDNVLEALYQAIRGGVTSTNELLDHFRQDD